MSAISESLIGGNWLNSLFGQTAFSDEQKEFFLDAANIITAYMQATSKFVYALLVIGLVGVIGVWVVAWALFAGKGGNA